MFYVIEIQEGHDGSGAVVAPIKTAETQDQAMSMYHQILMYAAVSTLKHHTCIVMDGTGMYYAKECYSHPAPIESEE